MPHHGYRAVCSSRSPGQARARISLLICLGAAVFLLLGAGDAWSTNPGGAKSSPSASPRAGVGETSDLNVHITAETLRYDDKNHFLTLDGNVVFTHGDTVILCPHAEFQTEKQVGHCTGGVRILQPGTTVTGNRLDAFYVERRAVLVGNVQVVTEKGSKPGGAASGSPRPAPARVNPGGPGASTPAVARSMPTVILANEMQYFWEKKEGDAIGNVKIRQGDKRGFSDRAHYDGNANVVRMYSNVRYERGDRDWMVAQEALLDLGTNIFTAKGGIEAEVHPSSSPSAAPSASASPQAQGDRILRPVPPVVEPVYIPDGMPRDAMPSSGSASPAEPSPRGTDRR